MERKIVGTNRWRVITYASYHHSAAFFSSSSNINAIAANCLLGNEWGCIFVGDKRWPPITCYAGRWLNTTDLWMRHAVVTGTNLLVMPTTYIWNTSQIWRKLCNEMQDKQWVALWKAVLFVNSELCKQFMTHRPARLWGPPILFSSEH